MKQLFDLQVKLIFVFKKHNLFVGGKKEYTVKKMYFI